MEIQLLQEQDLSLLQQELKAFQEVLQKNGLKLQQLKR